MNPTLIKRLVLSTFKANKLIRVRLTKGKLCQTLNVALNLRFRSKIFDFIENLNICNMDRIDIILEIHFKIFLKYK